jgi:biopolymer transport protein ExbD
MAMSVGSGGNEGSPVSEINTTPLIDVMLVLLIMFILTVPIQTHAVKIDTPGTPPIDFPEPRPTRNEITIDPRDNVFWNGIKVDGRALRAALYASARMEPQPELHIRPDPQARYETVDEVLAETKRAQIARMGFVGNEDYADF